MSEAKHTSEPWTCRKANWRNETPASDHNWYISGDLREDDAPRRMRDEEEDLDDIEDEEEEE